MKYYNDKCAPLKFIILTFNSLLYKGARPLRNARSAVCMRDWFLTPKYNDSSHYDQRVRTIYNDFVFLQYRNMMVLLMYMYSEYFIINDPHLCVLLQNRNSYVLLQ